MIIELHQRFQTRVVRLEHRLRRWRGAAVAASVLAACLMIIIGLDASLRPAPPSNYVAVFQKGDASPVIGAVFLNGRVCRRLKSPTPKRKCQLSLRPRDARTGAEQQPPEPTP